MAADGSLLSSNMLLDQFGEVFLTLDPHVLSWKPTGSLDTTACSCFGLKSSLQSENAIKFSDVYAVELIKWGPIGKQKNQMHRFVVHGFRKPTRQRSPWILTEYTFGHKDLQMCQNWVERISYIIKKEVGRPKNLLVFVHPLSGKGVGCKTWESVLPIFHRANVKTKVTITQKAGHALEMVSSMSNAELRSFDGVLTVGGDGFFNEILNGILLSRHKASYPPAPNTNKLSVEKDALTKETSSISILTDHDCDLNSDIRAGQPDPSEDGETEPLLCHSASTEPDDLSISSQAAEDRADQDSFLFPNNHFSFGIIPAGSTDSIVISTTGARDPVTSALHIVLGKKVSLDIAQVVRWKTSNSSPYEPCVRYAASFAGYGFYGDVVKESEKYRWMGPVRYDYAGTKVFLRHRSYEAAVSFLEPDTAGKVSGRASTDSRTHSSEILQDNNGQIICCVNCRVCQSSSNQSQASDNVGPARSVVLPDDARWLQSKGRFHCVGAAIISCRNERAPDGLVANAHLADGYMHLILIKECPRPLYLWHLIKLSRSSNPLDFKFVEHHRTPAFTFTTTGNQSVWNLDGELFQACQLSAQVFRGLVNLYAAGPEA